MKDPIKVSEEELKTAVSLQSEFQNTVYEFGSLYLEKMQIDNAIKLITTKETELQEKLKTLREKEDNLIQNVYKKYGDGKLDLEKGLFIPSK